MFSVSRRTPAIATVSPDEPFTVVTRDSYGGRPVTPRTIGVSSFFSRDKTLALTGPIRVSGAESGMWLRIGIREIQLANHGVLILRSGVGILGKSWTERARPYQFDVRDGTANNAELGSYRVSPMVGTIAVAPRRGEPWGGLNGEHGGNLDCPEFAVGSDLVFEVQVPGALVYMGDGHALMGRGELGGTGIEIGMRVSARARALDGPVPTPEIRGVLVHTIDGWLGVVGRGLTAEAAAERATTALARWLNFFGDAEHAIARIALRADVRVCQMVNNRHTVIVGLHPPQDVEAAISRWLAGRP